MPAVRLRIGKQDVIADHIQLTVEDRLAGDVDVGRRIWMTELRAHLHEPHVGPQMPHSSVFARNSAFRPTEPTVASLKHGRDHNAQLEQDVQRKRLEQHRDRVAGEERPDRGACRNRPPAVPAQLARRDDA